MHPVLKQRDAAKVALRTLFSIHQFSTSNWKLQKLFVCNYNSVEVQQF